VTIHRVGPSPEPYRVELGKLLVTIDDLEALMTHLRERKPDDFQVEFDGGYLTDAADLEHLSDMELQSLRVKNSEVQVVLSPTDASAIGDFVACQEVYRVWARSRQTELKPASLRTFTAWAIFAEALAFAVFVLYSSIGIYLSFRRDVGPLGLLFIGGAIVLGLISMPLVYYIYVTFGSRRKTYAIIEPATLADYRQRASTQTYPRRSWIVAILSTIIAVAAIVAAVWVGLKK
jgi:hypothetical protein